jgi:ubiquinol-cytochrome c reductase cytochrome c1 subunit
MTQQEFDSALKDLVTFLVYVAEPHKLERYSLGVWVLMFLMVLAVFAYLLKKAYWKNI